MPIATATGSMKPVRLTAVCPVAAATRPAAAVLKEVLEIGIQYPAHLPPRDHLIQGRQGMVSTQSRAPTKRAGLEILFVDTGQDLDHASLKCPTCDRRNAPRTLLFFAGLGDVNPPYRLRLIRLTTHALEHGPHPLRKLFLRMLWGRTAEARQTTRRNALCDSAFPTERRGRLLQPRSISGLLIPFTCVLAYHLPVYASQRAPPPTTRESLPAAGRPCRAREGSYPTACNRCSMRP